MLSVPRQPDVLDDLTPLDGSRIDVGSRIGWLLRTTRSVHRVPLRQMASGLSESGVQVSVASLSRIESEGLRSGAVIDGYERVLGLDPGHLRSVIDALCRTFDYAPVDVSPGLGPADLDEYSRSVDAVLLDEPRGGDWLRFAREHEDDRRFGLPVRSMQPLVARLASETSRAVGIAYLTRYEALSRLRCSAYAPIVDEVVREIVRDPDTQVVVDLMIVVSERPTRSLFEWATELLSHPTLGVVRGASLAIENMRSVGGISPDAWLGLAPAFVRAYALATDDQPRRVTLTKLFKNLPPRTRTAIRAELKERLEHVPGPVGWDVSRQNAHLELARQLADTVCAEMDHPEQPLLARMLFEILYEFRGTRSGTSGLILMASPFVEVVHPHLMDLAVNGPDETSRDGARGVVSALQTAATDLDVTGWLESGDAGLVHTAYLLLGNAGRSMSDEELEAGLAADPVTAGKAIYSAGMAQHPRLCELAADPTRPGSVRSAAAWWLREGGRIVR